MESVSLISDFLGLLGVVFSLLAWLQARQLDKKIEHEKQRQNKRITVILTSGKREIKLPVGLRRAEFTRSEILGWIGMLPMKDKGKRFSLEFLNKPEFFRRINEIISAEGDTTLVIPCEEQELDQFDVPKS